MTNYTSSPHILTEDGWAYVAPAIGGGTTSREWQQKFPSLWHAVSAASQDLLVAAELVRNKQVKARLMLHWDTVNGIAHALDRYARQPHSPVNQPAVSAPSLLEQGRLEEQHQPDQGMTSTSGDAQTSCPPVNCSNGTAREQPAREGSCNASSLERSGSVDAERDNTTVTNAPAPSSHLEGAIFLHKLVENAFSWGKQNCNYLNPAHIEKFIEATRKGMLPKEAATWVANGPSPKSHVTASVQRPRSGFQIIEEISESNSDVSSKQHHRHTADSVSQTSALLDDAPAVIRLSDSQVSFGAARDLHEPRNSGFNEKLHVAHQLVATTSATSPAPLSRVDGDPARLKPIPIEAAKRIAKEYGYDQVLIYARRCHDTPEPHGEHMTTYGRTREHCDVAARIGDTLKKFMGWEV